MQASPAGFASAEQECSNDEWNNDERESEDEYGIKCYCRQILLHFLCLHTYIMHVQCRTCV